MNIVTFLLASAISFHGLTPADSRDGLANPERGWRFEIGIGRLPEDPVKFTHVTDQWPFPRFVKDGVTVSQAYCYLTQFANEPVSGAKIAALEADFAKARKAGVKFLLRFAYEFRDDPAHRAKEAPTADRVLAHIKQLTPVVRRNSDVIYCLQTGWVGLWGEFHSSTHGIEKNSFQVAAIIKATLEMLPPDRTTMMRRIAYKENALKALDAEGEVTATNAWMQVPTARIGFFNDGTLANWWDGATFTEEPYADGGNREYERVHREGLYTPVDGELFWTGQYSHPVFADGYRAIDRFSYQHYTTFSLVHGHSLLDQSTTPWTIDGWKVTPVTAEALKFFGIDYDPAYFEGVPYRTAYEFIRDHLGYRLAVKKVIQPDDVGQGGTVRLTLHNYGFAPPVNPRWLYLAVSDGARAEEWNMGFDCRKLMPGVDIEVETRIPAVKMKGAKLALWLPDAAKSLRYRPEYAIRLATQMPVEMVGGRLLHILSPLTK